MAKDSPMKTATFKISEAELDRQIREAKKRGVSEPEAMSVLYRGGKVYVELASGWSFAFDPRIFPEFAGASEAELKQIGLWGRYTVTCPPLDVDISIGGILFKLVGEKYINATLARRNGSTTSEKKKAASRANGKLGGRPRKGEPKTTV